MITVVIPVFNAGGFIKRTIDSVLAQTYRDYEVVVVDDGSTDNTAEVVDSYGGAVRCIHQENAGDGPARNAGIAAAKERWIAFLDHDDEWLPEKLELQMGLLERNPDLRWCSANYYRAGGGRMAPVGDAAMLEKELRGRDYFEDFFTAVAQKGCSLITATMVVHKEVFERVGYFDSCWLLGADLDMWWRIAYSFPRIGYLPRPLAIMHLGELDVVASKRHFAGKRGEDARGLVAKHLSLADEHRCAEQFRPLAKKVIRQSLATTIYRGFKTDARVTVRQFHDLVPWYWRFATYILTIFPGVTAVIARAITYVADKLRPKSQVTRRWSYGRNDEKAD